MYKNTLRKEAHAWKQIIELRLSEQEASMLRFYVDELAITDLHWGMFIPAIKGKELGHGSNIQGLETTGTFDPKSDDFIINNPTLTSRKWWPGGLVADIGMKFGNGAYNTMDNGVLWFDHVHIPRDQMLMRVSQVTRESKCVQSDVPRKLLYGTMVYVRQTIVANASCALSRAVCIATRNSAVQRQFVSQDGGPETQVIDYKTQQNKIFPLVATAYAYKFIGEWLKWLYTDVTQRLQANDFSTFPKAHACTAGLESLITSTTADAIEECRKLCSGHGYLCSSGLPELFVVYHYQKNKFWGQNSFSFSDTYYLSQVSENRSLSAKIN
ncbi:hypothetical protein GIB67_014802 [Kingdonia uniflora]|uniref:Peroxisomal acyl-coenzyme A oxidase 1 n=1 Tax=Kingdonia uniflora TaxID=39325 RepID=A0A7J7NUU9_9MAGN|nr:hypothetical protein GIB67_014802 [Kingdonia uniflora]